MKCVLIRYIFSTIFYFKKYNKNLNGCLWKQRTHKSIKIKIFPQCCVCFANRVPISSICNFQDRGPLLQGCRQPCDCAFNCLGARIGNPSKHTTSQKCRYNVAATSRRCSDIETTLLLRCVYARTMYLNNLLHCHKGIAHTMLL